MKRNCEIRKLFQPEEPKEPLGHVTHQVSKGQDEIKARAPLSGAFRIKHGEAGKLL